MALWFLLGSWTVAHAADVDMTWALSVDGTPAGEHTVHVRDLGEDVRIIESYVEVLGPSRRPAPTNWTRILPWNWGVFRPKRAPVPVYRHRMTASRETGGPAVHSVYVAGGRAVGVQGRQSGGVWRLTVTEEGSTRPVTASDVTLSNLVLLDPLHTWREDGDQFRGSLLDLRTAALAQGELVRVGPATVAHPDGTKQAQHWEWRAAGETWRLYYGDGGALLRYEASLGGRSVQADLVGQPPIVSDDFNVPVLPSVESIEITER